MESSSDNNVIRKNEFPENMDFDFLRQNGITHLGELAGKVWTDHNVHDPGITILEMLCYALIDLGYRTQLPVQDLLARDPSGPGYEDNFFTPAEILTNNPVTILDYRKLLIDTPGIRNAWLEINTEHKMYVNSIRNDNQAVRDELSCTPRESDQYRNVPCSQRESVELTLNGLYDVYLELERPPGACRSDFSDEKIKELLETVRAKLHAHRNLSEDFVNIHILCEEEIFFCGNIVLKEGANPEKVHVAILKALQEFLSPPLQFYTLEELLEKGTPIEDAFAGRPLLSESYGFLDMAEVEHAKRTREIHLSDIYGLIGMVEGVKSVKDLILKYRYAEGETLTGDEGACDYWVHTLRKNHVPVFCPDKTCFDFSGDGSLRIQTNKNKVLALFRQAVSVNKKVLYNELMDKSIKDGAYRSDLKEYYSIQNEFPRTYGIGEGGLAPDAPDTRKAQALQLKGYLLFFDQLLANYFSQLSHLRDLFSFRPDSLRADSSNHTYFGAGIDTVPDIEKLIRFYTGNFDEPEGSVVALPINPEEIDSGSLAEAEFTHLTFQSVTERETAIRQLSREFGQNEFDIGVLPDECGFIFELVTNISGVQLVSKRIYKTAGEARQAAKTISFLASLDKAYHRVNDYEDQEFSFEIVFTSVDYLTYLTAILEDRNAYARRRRDFLDHLLDRFAEQFTDYSLLAYYSPESTETDRILQENECKARFLSALPGINRNRGKAYDYRLNGWNNENVSGLEKRVAALACLDPAKRQHLCKFDVIRYDDRYVYQLIDEAGEVVLASDVEYTSEAEAKAAYTSLLENLNDRSNYQGSVDNDSFAIRVRHGLGSATFSRKYTSAEERDANIQRVAGLYGDAGNEENVFVSEYISRLILSSEDGTALKESRRHYASEEEARRDINYFKKNINNQLWLDDNAERVKLELASTTIPDVYLDTSRIQPEEFPVITRHRWNINGLDGTNWVESKAAYDSEEEAMEALNQFLRTRKNVISIRLEEEEQGTTIRVSDGSRNIAQGRCRNIEEGEKIREEMQEFLGDREPGDRWVRAHDNACGWVVEDPDGTFLRSYRLYDNRRKAKALADKAFRLLKDDSSISMREMAGGQYCCVLSDSGEPVGISARYDSEQSARDRFEKAREAYEACNVSLENGLTGYQFRIPAADSRANPLLQSYHLYRDRKEAISELETLLKTAKKSSAYYKTGDEPHIDFSFVIRDSGNHYLAAHPEEYAIPEDRDKALEEIRDVMKKTKNPFTIRKEYTACLEIENEIILEGDRPYASAGPARRNMLSCLTCAMDSENYDERVLPGGYSQELILRNDQGEIIARYPKDYVGRIIGVNIISRIKQYLSPHLYRISAVEQPNEWKFRYAWISDENDQGTLAESTASFETSEQAAGAWEEFNSKLDRLTVEDQENGLLFKDDSGNEIGRTPENENISAASATEYISRVTENRRLLAAAPENEAAVSRIPGMRGGNYVYRVIRRDEHLAYYPCRCSEKPSVELLDHLWTTAVQGYDYLEICLAGDICISIDGRYYFVIRDKYSHEIYLRSYVGYADSTEAINAFREYYVRIIDKASDAANYGPWDPVNPPAILTSPPPPEKKCEVTCPPDPAPLAVVSPHALETYSIDQLADLMCSFPVRLGVTREEDCDQEEEICYFFHLLNPDRERNDECKEDWISSSCYETIREAWEAFRAFELLLRYRGNYHFHLDEEDCCYRLVIREVLLVSKSGYAEEADAWAALTEMLKLTCSPENFHVDWDEDTCAFTICLIEPGYRLACDPVLYYSKKEAADQVKKIRQLLQKQPVEPLQISVVNNEIDYGFEISDLKQQVLWRNFQTYNTEEQAENAAWQAIAYGRELNFYGEFNGQPALFSKNKNYLKNGFSLQETDLIAVRGSDALIEPENLAAILMRNPLDKDPEGISLKFYTTAENGVDPVLLLRSSSHFTSADDALTGLDTMRAAIEKDDFDIIEKDQCGRYEVCLTDASKMPACHPQRYSQHDDVKEAIDRIMKCTNPDGMHLVEHILLRPENARDCECLIPAIPDKSCCIELPLPEDPCRKPERDERGNEIRETDHYVPHADPYSFWVTVVLPGWTKRFCHQERRTAFQQLIRKEAPAHIGINIHWLSPEDMCEFEMKYRRWLRWKSCKTVCGQRDYKCDLINCLGMLVNMPACEVPEGDLGCDCDSPVEIGVTDLAINYLFHQSPEETFGVNFLSQIGIAGGIRPGIAANAIRLPGIDRRKILANPVSALAGLEEKAKPKEAEEKPVARSKAKASDKSAKAPSKSELIKLIRQRMASYKSDVEVMTERRFTEKEEYQRAVLFLGGPAPHDQYTALMGKLSDAYDRARSKKSLVGLGSIMANVTGYYIDQHVTNDHSVLPKEMRDALKEATEGLDAKVKKQVRERWNAGEWENWYSSKAARAAKKILAGK